MPASGDIFAGRAAGLDGQGWSDGLQGRLATVGPWVVNRLSRMEVSGEASGRDFWRQRRATASSQTFGFLQFIIRQLGNRTNIIQAAYTTDVGKAHPALFHLSHGASQR